MKRLSHPFTTGTVICGGRCRSRPTVALRSTRLGRYTTVASQYCKHLRIEPMGLGAIFVSRNMAQTSLPTRDVIERRINRLWTCGLGGQRSSPIPQSQNNDSSLCLVFSCIHYLGPGEGLSDTLGDHSFHSSFSFHQFFTSPPSTEGCTSRVWLTNICHPTSLQLFFGFLFTTSKTSRRVLGKGGASSSHRDVCFANQCSGFSLEAISQVGPTLIWERIAVLFREGVRFIGM